jgi:hypothetical protein
MPTLPRLLLAAFFTLALTTLAPATDKETIQSHLLRYNKSGKAVVDMILSKNVAEPEVEKQVNTLVEEAQWFIAEYALAYPKGTQLLKTVTDNIAAMRKLSFDELEKEWHDLGYFEKHPDKAGLDLKEEENEHFTDPIHALVHPLLVLKAAQAYAANKKDEDLKSMKEEMEEGLEQVEKLAAVLLKP